MEFIIELIEVNPEDARPLWDRIRARTFSSNVYLGLKGLLKFCAERRLGLWTPLYLPFISSSLPHPPTDKYAAVRTGDVFLSIEEEASLVRWIYEKATKASALSQKDLIETALVICNYQFAMRPKQIGLLRKRDCRVLVTEAGASTVHSILGTTRTATDLRHSGAMRQVDAGASAEDLAEFMGHSSLESGLIYFDTSATQAERVNEALGISETYKRLAVLGTQRFITSRELAKLKGGQQIAGAPHGIPIAGIGGCETGQPVCPYNPVTACYGCPKFLPVNELEIHRKVLADFRSVVHFFYDSSRGESESPAYLQLKRTISDVNAVILELENANE